MRAIVLFLICSFSCTLAYADLRNGDRAKFNYDKVPVYKIISTRVFQAGQLDLKLLVEGNICGNERSSLGSFGMMTEMNYTRVTHFTRGLKPIEPMACAEYSKETSVFSKFLFDPESDDPQVYDLDGNIVTLKKINARWQATIKNAENY